MERNKSIDGLVPKSTSHSAKKSTAKKVTKKASTKSVKKPAQKPNTKIKVTSVTTEKPVKKPTLEITVTEDVDTVKETIDKDRSDITEDFLKPVEVFDFDDLDNPKKKKKERKEKKKKEKTKKKPGKIRKTITSILLLLFLGAIGVVVWGIFWGNDIIAKITGGQGNIFDLLTFTNETYEPLKTDSNGRTNILAFGTSGFNMDGDTGNGTHDGAALTDSIMAISLDQENGDIAMVSLPRDLKASPTCTATGKINEVYWCNNMYGDNEQAGAEALMTEVGSILGINFQYYAHINWASLIHIVNLLDGVNVVLDEDVLDYYGTGFNYYAGQEYHLDGEQALILSRARYGTMGGDFTRSANQQKILIGIKNKLIEKKLSITDYLSLAGALGDNLRTNFSVEELKSLAHLSFDFDFDSMRQISLLDPEPLLTTGTINGISYVLPRAGVGNYGNIQSYLSTKLSSDPRVYEEPSILILNGTEETGLAGAEKSELEQNGYSNITVDNAPEGEYTEKYTVYSLNNKPGTKLLLENYYNTTAKSADYLPENFPRDYDFIILLGP